MTTIYWGNLSVCEKTDEVISGYSCNQKLAYRAVSLFEAILLLIQSIFLLLFIRYQNDILKEYSEYAEIVEAGDDNDIKNQIYKQSSSSAHKSQPSADL
jgi:hypothetical protein